MSGGGDGWSRLVLMTGSPVGPKPGTIRSVDTGVSARRQAIARAACDASSSRCSLAGKPRVLGSVSTRRLARAATGEPGRAASASKTGREGENGGAPPSSPPTNPRPSPPISPCPTHRQNSLAVLLLQRLLMCQSVSVQHESQNASLPFILAATLCVFVAHSIRALKLLEISSDSAAKRARSTASPSAGSSNFWDVILYMTSLMRCRMVANVSFAPSPDAGRSTAAVASAWNACVRESARARGMDGRDRGESSEGRHARPCAVLSLAPSRTRAP